MSTLISLSIHHHSMCRIHRPNHIYTGNTNSPNIRTQAHLNYCTTNNVMETVIQRQANINLLTISVPITPNSVSSSCLNQFETRCRLLVCVAISVCVCVVGCCALCVRYNISFKIRSFSFGCSVFSVCLVFPCFLTLAFSRGDSKIRETNLIKKKLLIHPRKQFEFAFLFLKEKSEKKNRKLCKFKSENSK